MSFIDLAGRGVMTVHSWPVRATRVIATPYALSVLNNGHARAIRFSTPAAICEVLGCRPGDLMSHLPG